MSDGINEAAQDQESSVVTVQGTTTAVKEDSRMPITVVNSSSHRDHLYTVFLQGMAIKVAIVLYIIVLVILHI